MNVYRFNIKASIISEDNVNKYHTMANGVAVAEDEDHARRLVADSDPFPTEKLVKIEQIHIERIETSAPSVTLF